LKAFDLGVLGDLARIGMEEGDGLADLALDEKGVRLRAEFLGKIERVDLGVADFMQAQRDAARAATRFKNLSGLLGRQEVLEDDLFGVPQPKPMSRPRVVHDRPQVIEVRSNLRRGQRFY